MSTRIEQPMKKLKKKEKATPTPKREALTEESQEKNKEDEKVMQSYPARALDREDSK